MRGTRPCRHHRARTEESGEVSLAHSKREAPQLGGLGVAIGRELGGGGQPRDARGADRQLDVLRRRGMHVAREDG